MSLFNFWKKEKPQKKFIVGRHQQFLSFKKILNENIPDMEWQITINKDVGEYNEIIKDIKNLKNYIRSEIFTTRFDVLRAKNDADKIFGAYYL